MSRFAAAREDGLKPYVITVTSWGRSHDLLLYAKDGRDAKWRAVGRQRHMSAKARRATPEDMAAHPERTE